MSKILRVAALFGMVGLGFYLGSQGQEAPAPSLKTGAAATDALRVAPTKAAPFDARYAKKFVSSDLQVSINALVSHLQTVFGAPAGGGQNATFANLDRMVATLKTNRLYDPSGFIADRKGEKKLEVVLDEFKALVASHTKDGQLLGEPDNQLLAAKQIADAADHLKWRLKGGGQLNVDGGIKAYTAAAKGFDFETPIKIAYLMLERAENPAFFGPENARTLDGLLKKQTAKPAKITVDMPVAVTGNVEAQIKDIALNPELTDKLYKLMRGLNRSSLFFGESARAFDVSARNLKDAPTSPDALKAAGHKLYYLMQAISHDDKYNSALENKTLGLTAADITLIKKAVAVSDAFVAKYPLPVYTGCGAKGYRGPRC